MGQQCVSFTIEMVMKTMAGPLNGDRMLNQNMGVTENLIRIAKRITRKNEQIKGSRPIL
jgi:hypothetical protein